MSFLKQFLFFSRADKIGIFSLSAIVFTLLILNVTLSRQHEINDDSLPYQPAHTSVMSNDTVADAVPTAEVDDTILATADTVVVKKTSGERNPPRQKINLNTADSTALMTLRGIGAVYASRIIKYRNLLGGYYDKSQILEVYGITKETYSLFCDDIVASADDIVKIPVNTASFKEILRHPYFDYDMVVKIVRAREVTPFTSMEDFIARTDLSDRRFTVYLSF
ncbi:MAG: helix-hairpin-helix domain-containing protein [Bacteroidales bacterium]|nr:helix-hairpin-helix domain-containing protein [Bacteroidales bacterium]MBR5720379.1 helix-hairpin-helix domain-containing protein [Bacteroidales bacterium]